MTARTRKSSTKPAAAEQADLEIKAQEAPQVDETPEADAAEAAITSTEPQPVALQLPPVAELTSWKLPFAGALFVTSSDGGVTNEQTDCATISGVPVDFQLQISKPSDDASYKWDGRFRLFFRPAHDLSLVHELNLNSLSQAQSGDIYCPAPLKSLISALMMATESADDMHAFAQGMQIQIVPGRRTVFLNLAVNNGRHMTLIRGVYQKAPNTAEDLIQTVQDIKRKFRAENLLCDTPAVLGAELVLGSNAVDVDVDSEEVPF